MLLPCGGAALIAGCELPTGAGAQRVERAGGMFADFARQGSTAWRLFLRTFHTYVMGADRNGQMIRHRAVGMGIGLRPVKRDAEGGAAGTASKANLTHGVFGRG